VVPLESLLPCPVQPPLNVSMRLVEQLAVSMKAGRHELLIEVEPLAGQPGRYQIVCGEQGWRAALEAGMSFVLVRVLPRLTYLDRLRKQLEENRLRAALDPVEEAHAVVLTRTLLEIATAEALLCKAGLPFDPLESKVIADRQEFGRHLEALKRLLVETGTHVVRSARGLVCGPLSPWRETERALGISEAARKQKVGILRLPPELQDEVRTLPAEHAIQISRLEGGERQAELVERAPSLTHRQVQAAVDRLRTDPQLTVEEALEAPGMVQEQSGPLEFEGQIALLADLCRQLTRRLGYLRARLTPPQQEQVLALLADLRLSLDGFE
jgi:ParB-like chromosome segregation protein Spo0J